MGLAAAVGTLSMRHCLFVGLGLATLWACYLPTRSSTLVIRLGEHAPPTATPASTLPVATAAALDFSEGAQRRKGGNKRRVTDAPLEAATVDDVSEAPQTTAGATDSENTTEAGHTTAPAEAARSSLFPFAPAGPAAHSETLVQSCAADIAARCNTRAQEAGATIHAGGTPECREAIACAGVIPQPFVALPSRGIKASRFMSGAAQQAEEHILRNQPIYFPQPQTLRWRVPPRAVVMLARHLVLLTLRKVTLWAEVSRVFMDLPPSREKEEAEDKIIAEKDARHAELERLKQEQARAGRHAAGSPRVPAEVFVQLGCGNAALLATFCAPLSSLACFGVDPSAVNVRQAHFHLPHIDVRRGHRAPHLPDASATVVLSVGELPAQPDGPAACEHIAEMLRLLKPDTTGVIWPLTAAPHFFVRGAGHAGTRYHPAFFAHPWTVATLPRPGGSYPKAKAFLPFCPGLGELVSDVGIILKDPEAPIFPMGRDGWFGVRLTRNSRPFPAAVKREYWGTDAPPLSMRKALTRWHSVVSEGDHQEVALLAHSEQFLAAWRMRYIQSVIPDSSNSKGAETQSVYQPPRRPLGGTAALPEGASTVHHGPLAADPAMPARLRKMAGPAPAPQVRRPEGSLRQWR